MSFLFAQYYHSSMKNVGPVRKEMGERTIFNILGPLTNPANASIQLLGVYNNDLVEKLAEVLKNLGVKRGMAVCGNDGLDEITLTGPTHCCEIRDGGLTSFDITPEQFGFETCDLKELIGGTPQENAQITRDILSGKRNRCKEKRNLDECRNCHLSRKRKHYNERGSRYRERNDRQRKGS